MSISRVKTFVDGEVLFAADLEAEFDNWTTNQETIGWPATTSRAMAGNSLKLDADDTTLIKASVDDIVQIVSNGTITFQVDGTVASAVNGIGLIAGATTVDPIISSIGAGSDIGINMVPKGDGTFGVDGVVYSTHTSALLAYRMFGG